MECDVRYADVRWSVSPASPAWGRRTKVSKTSLVPSLPAAGVNELTESPLSTPVVQIGDVGEHVIEPVITEPRVAHDTMQIADQ